MTLIRTRRPHECVLCLPARGIDPIETGATRREELMDRGWALYQRGGKSVWAGEQLWVCDLCIAEVPSSKFVELLGPLAKWISPTEPPNSAWKDRWDNLEPTPEQAARWAQLIAEARGELPEVGPDAETETSDAPVGLRSAISTSNDAPRRITMPRTTEAVARQLMGLTLRREIGRGAMGLVYEAVDDEGRAVALKVLSPHDGINEEHAERFRREARLLERLDHPNIVRLYRYQEQQGFHCFVMEYIDGVSLEEVIRVGPMSLARALSVGEQLCDALAHAHEGGIIHRDVKPGNVLIGRDEKLRLADFGIGKAPGAGTGLGTVTAAGRVYGTPAYMAPEQLTTESIDATVDIYALGVLLYECLTGKRPMRDPSSGGVVLEPVDATIDPVLAKATHDDPLRRYGDAAEFGRALLAVRLSL